MKIFTCALLAYVQWLDRRKGLQKCQKWTVFNTLSRDGNNSLDRTGSVILCAHFLNVDVIKDATIKKARSKTAVFFSVLVRTAERLWDVKAARKRLSSKDGLKAQIVPKTWAPFFRQTR